MIDLKLIRKDPELFRQGGELKHIPCAENVDKILALDQQLREVLPGLEEKRSEQKKAGKLIGQAGADEREGLLARQRELKREIQAMGERQKELKAAIDELLLLIPNPPDTETPKGKSEEENVELRAWGKPPEFSFPVRDHLEIAEAHILADFLRAGEIAGSRNYFLRGQATMLEEAVLSFALQHMVKKGFEPLCVPVLVRDETMRGTGYYPGGEEQAYRVLKDELSLVGTAEVPLTAFHGGEILEEDKLPIKLVARSFCFRREAGTYGKDTKGFYRVHQFQKVEQVIVDVADEDRSREHQEYILKNAEEVLQALELPYRVVDVCGGDLGMGQIRKYDLETWMPSRKNYCETHSASRFHEFQARRLNIRYRDKQGKVRFCHTLNNTVIASPRVLIPLLEVHQQEDGSVRVPEVLHQYLPFKMIGGGEVPG